MRVSLFCHSLLSDWNHGNAHFLRGVLGELVSRGHSVEVYEPIDAWSVTNLVHDHGLSALYGAQKAYSWLKPHRIDSRNFDPEEALSRTDLALVHEWTDPALVARIGLLRGQMRSFVALFHDTHHRMVTDPAAMSAYDLSGYDGVLAFGSVLSDLYRKQGYPSVWTWHEAADVRVFYPRPSSNRTQDGNERLGDVVFIGNWGDDERTRELHEFLIAPVRDLGLQGSVYGVRYPNWAISDLERAGLVYRGWLPNFEVPEVFARHRVTIHVPRGPYVRALRGIPTIRPFEALACGIPLISAPWDDTDSLFRAGLDYLEARSGEEVRHALKSILAEPSITDRMTRHGLSTVRNRHTCSHRVDELLAIVRSIGFDHPSAGDIGAAQADCQSGCESGCQSGCESGCQSGCESGRQSGCESGCQSGCESNSKSYEEFASE